MKDKNLTDSKDLTVLFMNMREDSKVLTTTVLERAVVMAQVYLNKALLNKNINSRFLIIGGCRVRFTNKEETQKIFDFVNIESRVKQVVILLLNAIIQENINSDELILNLMNIIEGINIDFPEQKQLNVDYLPIVKILIQIIYLFREQIIITPNETLLFNLNIFTLNNLITTESELRLTYNLAFNSITTYTNLNIIIEYLLRNLQINSINLISSSEHLPRVNHLFNLKISELIDEMLKTEVEPDIILEQSRIWKLVQLRRKFSREHQEFEYPEFKINYSSENSTKIQHIRPLNIKLRNILVELLALPLSITGLYKVIENKVVNTREIEENHIK